VLRSLGGSGRSGNYCRTALQSTAHPGTQPCVLHSEQAHVGGGRPALAARCTRLSAAVNGLIVNAQGGGDDGQCHSLSTPGLAPTVVLQAFVTMATG
jgi:hypothetical protein